MVKVTGVKDVYCVSAHFLTNLLSPRLHISWDSFRVSGLKAKFPGVNENKPFSAHYLVNYFESVFCPMYFIYEIVSGGSLKND